MVEACNQAGNHRNMCMGNHTVPEGTAEGALQGNLLHNGLVAFFPASLRDAAIFLYDDPVVPVAGSLHHRLPFRCPSGTEYRNAALS